MSSYKLNIVHLYPVSMNTYGDRGNVLALQKRCQWRNIDTNIIGIEVGDTYDFRQADIVFAGGGQDSNQLRIKDDLLSRSRNIKIAIDTGIVFLTICGTYQLFGHYFRTSENITIKGISVFDSITEASDNRKIGNVVIEHTIQEIIPKTLVGFENHSGNTWIGMSDKGQVTSTMTAPLGKVVKGFGNNGKDGMEGARYKNCFGTYLHGSLLPKNPHFTDYLIYTALKNKYGIKINLDHIPDELEVKAHNFILSKTI